MSTWDNEDEYGEIDGVDMPVAESNGFTAVTGNATTSALPQEVLSRISAYAERTGKTMDEVTAEFFAEVKMQYGVDDPASEDADLLIDWAEQMIVVTRRSSGGGNSKLQTWVGCFVGVADKARDRLANIVKSNLKLFADDPADAIGSGRLGVYENEGGYWYLRTKEGLENTELPVAENPVPPHGIKTQNGAWVCLTTYNNKASPEKQMGRYYYFLGNQEEEFVKNGNIQLWRIDMTNDNRYLSVNIGRPCKVQVVPPRENATEAFKDVLTTYSEVEITYTDEFVNEDVRPLLHPSRYLADTELHDLFVHIDSLEETFESKKEFLNIAGEKRAYGPLVITKGTITRMSTEPRESEFDEEGFNYSMTLSSSIAGDIDCWIPGAVGKCTQPFVSHWGEHAFPYAERTTVLVFGRLGMKAKDGLPTPKLTAFGIYADPRRSRRRMEGGDTGVGQFN